MVGTAAEAGPEHAQEADGEVDPVSETESKPWFTRRTWALIIVWGLATTLANPGGGVARMLGHFVGAIFWVVVLKALWRGARRIL